MESIHLAFLFIEKYLKINGNREIIKDWKAAELASYLYEF